MSKLFSHRVEEFVSGKSDVTTREIISNLILLRDVTRGDQMVVAHVLGRLGYMRYQKRTASGREWRYRIMK